MVQFVRQGKSNTLNQSIYDRFAPMSKCNFSITFAEPADVLVNKMRSAIEGQGGQFNGDLSTGNFEVSIVGTLAGSYIIAGQQIKISIDSKPIFVSCNQIENFLKERFSK